MGWIIDPYIQCFFYCSTEVLVLPPNYIEIIISDLVTTDVTMVKDSGGCLLMFFEPLCKSSRGFTNVSTQYCLLQDHHTLSNRALSKISLFTTTTTFQNWKLSKISSFKRTTASLSKQQTAIKKLSQVPIGTKKIIFLKEKLSPCLQHGFIRYEETAVL